MNEDQKARLTELLPAMRVNARRAVSQNDYFKAFGVIQGLEVFLKFGEDPSGQTAEEWIAIAEKAAAGAEKPGVIKGMTMEQVLSGLPPEALR